MKRLLNLRVNGWIFLAFSCLYFAIMSIAALLATLNTIGICYSGLTEISMSDMGERQAVYEYTADERVYSYAVPVGNASELLIAQAETVFYFKEYPAVRVGAVEMFIYPAFTAALGLAFALIFRQGLDSLDENSRKLRDYAIPVFISVLSLIPVCINISWVCGLYTSLLSALSNVERSVRAISITLGILNGNLLMWGLWSKWVQRRTTGKNHCREEL